MIRRVISMPLHHKITIGMIVGLLLGILLHGMSDDAPEAYADMIWWTDFIGKDVFIGLLKMLIAPLILSSIIAGVTSLPDSRQLGAIGWKTFGFYVMSTIMAVAIGIGAVLLIRPGEKEDSVLLRENRAAQLREYREQWQQHHPGSNPLDEKNRSDYLAFVTRCSGDQAARSDAGRWQRIDEARQQSARDMVREKIVAPILSNPFAALAEGNTLGIITFAILTGLACVLMGEPAQPVVSFFQGLNGVVMKVTLWVMEIAPYSIACLMASTVGRLGADGLMPLAWYGGTVVGGIALHMLALLALVAFLGRMNPLVFLRGIRNAWMIAFTTTSSTATLPVTMECVIDNLKVNKKVAGFTLPVGATLNMDGTALYEGVAVIFMLQLYHGLDDVNVLLTGANIFVIFVTAVLASVGAAAIPSAGLVTMAIVATAVGLPVHYIVYLFVVDHLLDMFRTSTNVTGDAAAAVVVNHWENKRTLL